jgi:hypothetical protein
MGVCRSDGTCDVSLMHNIHASTNAQNILTASTNIITSGVIPCISKNTIDRGDAALGPELRRLRLGCGFTRGLSIERCIALRSDASLPASYRRVPERRARGDMTYLKTQKTQGASK